jgi:hypothetical protein
VSGHWWQSPSGRWYFLAAAASGLVPRVRGALGPATTDHRLLVARPERGPNVPVAVTAAPR